MTSILEQNKVQLLLVFSFNYCHSSDVHRIVLHLHFKLNPYFQSLVFIKTNSTQVIDYYYILHQSLAKTLGCIFKLSTQILL